MKEALDKAMALERERLALTSGELSLSFYGDNDWAIEFKGMRYVSPNKANVGFIQQVTSGNVKSLNEEVKEKRLAEAKALKKPKEVNLEEMVVADVPLSKKPKLGSKRKK